MRVHRARLELCRMTIQLNNHDYTALIHTFMQPGKALDNNDRQLDNDEEDMAGEETRAMRY